MQAVLWYFSPYLDFSYEKKSPEEKAEGGMEIEEDKGADFQMNAEES